MSDTRTSGGSDPHDPPRRGSTRPIDPREAETKARVDGADPARRFPSVPGVTLTGELGRGGMGVVYCGRQEKLGRTVAVKTLGTEYRGGAIERRFLNEGKNQARLEHPNVVICHDSGVTREGEPYLVLEYVGGPNLLEWVREHGPLGLVDALRLVLSLARALEHGLEKNLVHRDVKPENVLLKPDSRARSKAFPFVPKLADFGLSRSDDAQGTGRLTQQGEAWGSPQTMAPEQFDGFADVDHRADIYALGCVLHQALTGKPAFRESSLAELRKRKRDGPAPDPREIVPDLHKGTAELVVSMLAIDPDARPLGYTALEERLVAILDELQPAAQLEEARRKRVLLRVVLPLAVLTVTAVAWSIVRGRAPTAPNVAPIVTALRGPTRVDAGTQNRIVVEAADPEGGELEYEWTFEGPPWWKVPKSGPTPGSHLLNCPEPPQPGDYEIVARVRAVDAAGLASPEKELRLLVVAGEAGRPLTAPVVLTGTDAESFRKLWRFQGEGFLFDEDLERIWGRSIAGDEHISTALPRGPFVLTGRITVSRGMQRRSATLSVELSRQDGRSRAIGINSKEGVTRISVEARGFDEDQRRDLGDDEPVHIRVEWDGSTLSARVDAGADAPRELFSVSARETTRPETLRLSVFGGDFFLDDLVLDRRAPE